MPITSGERVSATRVENIIDHQRGRSQGRHWCRGFPSILCKRRRCSGPIGALTRIFDALWACAAGDMRVCPACRGTPDIHTLVEPIELRAAHAVTHLFSNPLEPGSFQCVGFDSDARREDCSRQAHMLPNQQ